MFHFKDPTRTWFYEDRNIERPLNRLNEIYLKYEIKGVNLETLVFDDINCQYTVRSCLKLVVLADNPISNKLSDYKYVGYR